MPKRKKRAGGESSVWINRAWEWLEPRVKSTLIAVVFIVVVVAVVWIVVKRKESNTLKAQLEYFEIIKVEDEAARVHKLEEFAKEHGDEDTSFQALMTLGEYNYKKDDLEKASQFYNDVISQTEGELIYFITVDALAPVYIDMGKAGEAAELYLKSAVFASNPAPFLSKFKAGKLFETAGNSDRAKEVYESLIADENTPSKIKLNSEEQLLWIAVSK